MKMAELARFFRGFGFTDVSTFLASGNVIFDCDSSPDVNRVEDAFEGEFGFRSEVFLRDRYQIRSVLDRVPWTGDDGVIEISFLECEPKIAAANSLEATAVHPERLSVSGSEVFLLRVAKEIPTTHKESTSVRMLGMTMTRRGLATVTRIHDRFILPFPEENGSVPKLRGRAHR